MDPGQPAAVDELARRILTSHRRIAVVGASATAGKPAHDVPLLMRQRGYEVFAINPTLPEWEGQPAYPSLQEAPKPVEIVDVFRKAEETAAVARDAVAAGARVLWLQLGIRNAEARAIAEEAGLLVVEDRCVNVEWKRLDAAGIRLPCA